MYDIVKFVCLLLLNLEWHYVTSLDTDGPTEHTDIISRTELFTSALHTGSEVYTKTVDTTDSTSSLSHFSEQPENSLAATGEANMSASDFSINAALFTATEASDVSDNVSQVIARSVSDVAHISSAEKMITSANTPCLNTTEIDSSFLSKQTTNNSAHGSTSVPHPSMEERDTFSSNGSVSSNFTTIPMSPENVNSYSTPSQSTEVSSSSNCSNSRSRPTPLFLTDVTLTYSSTATTVNPLTQVNLSAFVETNTPWVSTEQRSLSPSSPRTSMNETEMFSIEIGSDRTQPLSTQVTEHSAPTITDTTPCLSTEQISITASTPCPSVYETETSSTNSNSGMVVSSIEAGITSMNISNIDSTPYPLMEETGISASTRCLPSSETEITFSDNATRPCSSAETTVTSATSSNISTTPCQTKVTNMNISASTPCLLSSGTERSSSCNDTIPCSPTEATITCATDGNISITPCQLTEEISVSASTLSPVASGTEKAPSNNETVPRLTTQPFISSGTVSMEASISGSTPCTATTELVRSSSGSDSTPNDVSSVTVGNGDTTSCLPTTDMSISTTIPCSPSSGTEIFSAESSTIPYRLSEAATSSATDIGTTPCEEMSTGNGTPPCTLSKEMSNDVGTTPCEEMSTGNGTTPCTLSNTMSTDVGTTPCEEMNTGNGTTPCPLSKEMSTDVGTTPCDEMSTGNGTTPCPLSKEMSTGVGTTLCEEMSTGDGTTPCTLSKEMSTHVGTTPCEEVSTGNGTTPCTLSNRVRTDVGTTPCEEMSTGGGTTPYPLNKEMNTGVGTTPCLSTKEVSIVADFDSMPCVSDIGTTPCQEMSTTPCFLTKEMSTDIPATPCPEVSVDIGTTPCLSSKELIMTSIKKMTSEFASTPCLSTKEVSVMDLASTKEMNTDVGATPCLTTKEISTGILVSTPCLTSSGAERTLSATETTFGDNGTIPCLSSEADVGTRQCLSTKEISISASTTCPPSSGTERSSGDSDTVPAPSSQAGVSNIITTPSFMTNEQGISPTTPGPLTSSIDCVSTYVSTLSSSSAGTQLSYGATTDITSHYSTEVTTMFTSEASQSTDTTDSISVTDTDADTVTTEFTTYDYVNEDDSTSDSVTETEVDGTATTEFTTPDYDTDDNSVSVTEAEVETSDSITTTPDEYGQLTSSVGVTSTDSPIVITFSAVPRSYSAGTERPVISVHVQSSSTVYATTKADITSQIVTATTSSSIDMTFLSKTQSDVSISSVDDKNMSSASTTMDSLPGNIRNDLYAIHLHAVV